MKKLCLFGDSISKGVVIDCAKNRYAMTTKCFANILSGYASWLNITNFSMFGCTISKGRSLIARHMKDVENCDITVLEYGGNDSDHNWAEIAENPEGTHVPKTSLEDFKTNYSEIICGLQAMGKKIVILNLPPIDEEKYFAWFSDGLNGDNILKWLGGSKRYIYNFHESYNRIACELAEEYGIPVLDIRSAFLSKPDYSVYLCNDGIHPNENGHNLIAQVIESQLPRLVLELTGKPISAMA